MRLLLQRLLVVAACLGVGVGVEGSSSQRLVLGEGGYARLMVSPPPLPALTLAAWVNVTTFPEGVAPILTLVAPDAQSQVAFFLRHDGVGVLWGGPVGAPARALDTVDRHPRTRWLTAEPPRTRRRRREAVDYSGGLGDIVDLLADPRSGRSYDTWTPYGFVDVDQMGVEDLQAAPSSLSDGLHILPMREGAGRSESYSDWTNVPYELAMQESGRPTIITEPSGADDFVFFNWNVPPAAPQSIPESPNQWSPIWRDKTPKTRPKVVPKTAPPPQPPRTPAPAASPARPDGGWTSEVTEVKLELSGWRPQPIPGPSALPPLLPVDGPLVPAFRQPQQQPVPTRRPAPQTTTTTTEFPTTKASTKGKPTTTSPKRPAPFTTSPKRPVPITTSRTTPPAAYTRYTTRWFTPSIPTQTPAPVRKTPPRPARPNIPASRQPPRTPLWKLIKNPNMAAHHAPTKTKATTAFTIPAKPATTTRPFTLPSTTTTTTTRPFTLPSTTTTTTTTARPVTLPSTTTTTTRPPRTTTTTTTTSTTTTPAPTTTTTTTPRPRPPAPRAPLTTKPQVSGHRSKVSVWTGGAASKVNALQRDKWLGGAGLDAVSILPRHVQEFERAMERAPAVRDGDTAVVYSVPITDVEAFNAMYRQYQQQEATHAPAPPTEDEANPNRLEDVDLQPLQDYEETAAPVVLREEEAVLAPTEEPLPPTPARGMVAAARWEAAPTIHWPHLTPAAHEELRGDLPPPTTHHELLPSTTQRTPAPTPPRTTTQHTTPSTTTPPPPPTLRPAAPAKPRPPVFHSPPHTASPATPEVEPPRTSSTFAVFHEEAAAAAEPLAVPAVQEVSAPASHYQESSPLFLEQLPPQYLLPEDLPRPITVSRRHDDRRLEELIFSADPEELLRRGLLPRPVHYVNSQDEADRWLRAQYQGQDEAPVAAAVNTLPQETTKPTQGAARGFHFKKVPFDFQANEWYHVAFSWSSSSHQAEVYVNGRLVGTLTGVMAGRAALTGGGLTIVGHTLLPDLTDFDPTSRLQGEIMELNIWDRRLDKAEVQAVYSCGSASPATPALDWRQLSMRFYGEVLLEQSPALCGA